MPPTIEELLERIERLEARVLELSEGAHYHYGDYDYERGEEFHYTERSLMYSPAPGPLPEPIEGGH
jgi:hypothetical protein